MKRRTFQSTLLAVMCVALLPVTVQAQATKLTLGHGAAPANPCYPSQRWQNRC